MSSALEVTAARRAVLERFLLLAERAGEWEGVQGFAKAMILRHARHDPDQTFARLQGLVALWQAAQEEPDARRPDADPGAGAGRRLERDARPAGGAARRAAGGTPRADTATRSGPPTAAAISGARAEAGARS